MPTNAEHAEILVVLLLAVISVVLIAMTIIISLWVSRLVRRGRR